jgi:hypothetical protein
MADELETRCKEVVAAILGTTSEFAQNKENQKTTFGLGIRYSNCVPSEKNPSA